MLERRLEALVEPGSPVPSGDMRLAVVPQPQEPELPIPSPYAAQPALTLAIDYRGQPAVNHPAPVVTAAIIMPKATWFGGSPPSPDNFIDARHRGNAALPSMAEKVAALSLHAQTNPATRPEPFAQRSQAMPLLPPPDPLAPLMLLSEEERLALFT